MTIVKPGKISSRKVVEYSLLEVFKCRIPKYLAGVIQIGVILSYAEVIQDDLLGSFPSDSNKVSSYAFDFSPFLPQFPISKVSREDYGL